MILVVDIGNTNIVFGFFDGDHLVDSIRLRTDARRTYDEYAALLGASRHSMSELITGVEKIVIASVVPHITQLFIELLRDRFRVEPVLLDASSNAGIELLVDTPEAVGADRLANALALREQYGTPSLAIDFGTATTFDVVGPTGGYEGGIIAPGVQTSLDALVQNTAKLPRVDLSWPKEQVGKTTVAAMQLGSLVGYACLVQGLVVHLQREVGEFSRVVATGGLGGVMEEHIDEIDTYDPQLTLKGILSFAKTVSL